MRKFLMVGALLLLPLGAVQADVGINIGVGNVDIGINVPSYPQMVPVPGYPVYYAPGMNTNFFFYDGRYWVYQRDNWYSSGWYNGPWQFARPDVVPVFILRVPVRYYRRPPAYFHGWNTNAAPRWGDHWGSDWQRRRNGWDNWDRRTAPRPAPLPDYQRRYAGKAYPRSTDQQHSIQTRDYPYRSRDTTTGPENLNRQRNPEHANPQREPRRPTQPLTPGAGGQNPQWSKRTSSMPGVQPGAGANRQPGWSGQQGMQNGQPEGQRRKHYQQQNPPPIQPRPYQQQGGPAGGNMHPNGQFTRPQNGAGGQSPGGELRKRHQVTGQNGPNP